MATDKSGRRMTLRQLLSQATKAARNVNEHYRSTLSLQLYELRELSRPVRRRSRYPTVHAMQNAVDKVRQAGQEALEMRDQLEQLLEEIRQRARREQMSR